MLWNDASGQTAVNVMHVRSAGATAATVATAVDANVTANMWDTVISTASVNSLHVTPLDGVSATLVRAVSGAKWTGVSISEFIPQVATLISLRTPLRGPANRGRLFLPFCSEGDTSAGTVLSSNLALVQTAWNNFLTAMIAATMLPVVASYKHGTATAVTSILAEPHTATQRRRQQRNR